MKQRAAKLTHCRQILWRLNTDIRKPERSALLARLDAFLPQMRAANATLAAELAADPSAQKKYSIENVDETAPHIAMDLHCGVFEPQSEGAGVQVPPRADAASADAIAEVPGARRRTDNHSSTHAHEQDDDNDEKAVELKNSKNDNANNSK